MVISLLKHNEQACAPALSMLQETGKEAIVYPMAGKSFVGFPICDDFANSTVCGFFPSKIHPFNTARKLFKLTMIVNLYKTSVNEQNIGSNSSVQE